MQKQEDGIDSVSISPVHDFVENSTTFIQPYNTLIEIINEKTDVIEFKGRVLSPESEMTDSGLFTHELIFEGAEAYLKDSIQSYSFEFDKMPVENLKKVIAHHNNELKNEAYKHFKVGNVTVEKNIIPSDENYNEELKYFKRSDDKDTYETLMDLKEKYGGTFIFEPTNDVTLVHWLKETGNLTNTVIKIGKNLKSIQKKFDASEVITRLKPLGASSETANGDEIKLTIAEVNNGSPYIDIPQLIKLFGIQTGTVTFDDKHTPETLKKAAEDWIKEHEKKQARISLSLDALDLSYLKLDPDEFKIYNKHRVICPPLNIDEDLKIISIKVDLLKPYDKEVSFGERELGYAELEKERSIKNTNLIINKTVPGIIDRQTGGINRDVMVLNDYKITFEDLKLHQSNLLDEVNQILNSEYLVDEEVRADLLLKAQNVESLSNTIKDALESADERTINATKLVGLQNKMNAYRTSLKSFVIAKEGAKISLLKRLQILQSQYTEKKFSDAMETVAKTLPNGKWNDDTKTLTSDVPNQDKLDSIVNDLKLFVNNQDNALETKIGKSVDAKIVDTKNEFTRQFTEVNSKVDGIEIGGRNLLKNSKNIKMFQNNTGLGLATQNPDLSWTVTPSSDKIVSVYTWYNTNMYSPIIIGETYTLSLDITPEVDTEIRLRSTDASMVMFIGKAGVKKRVSITFTSKTTNPNFALDCTAIGKKITYDNLKLEKGNKATDYTPAPEDIDKSINDVKVKVETVEGGLTATNKKFETVYSKTETEQLLNSNLQPIKTDVNSTKSSITQLDKEVKSKVSQSTYMTDQANVVQRLNSADSERQQLSNQIADRVTLTEYSSGIEAIEQNTDQKLATMKTEVIQDGRKYSQEVSQQIYNASNKTLNQTLSQYINSISTGHQFTYDENGNISDFTVGSSGIKLNGRVIDMNDGDVIIKNGVTTITDAYIPKLFSKKATIEYLDAIGITARTLQARDKQASVNIENGSITMNRDSGARMDIGLDGIQSFNTGGSLRFSLTPTLVTTSAVGTSVSNVYLGAAPTGEARIVDMNGIPGDGAIGSYSYRPLRTLAIKFPLKANGYIGIDGNELRIMSDGLNDGGFKNIRADKGYFATVDMNNEINGTHFYIRPKRGGELRATYNDGGDTSYANFRSDGIYAPWIDYNGHIPGSHFYIRPAYGGEVRLTATGTTNNWASLRSDGIYVPWIDFNGQIPGSHLYIRPGSGGEVRFTRTGTTDQFINIKANDGDFNQISYNKWVQKSREEWKTGIRKWEVNASEVLTNEVEIYEFYYKNDLDYLTRGSVIGDGYKVPDFWLSKSKNGIDNTSVIWTLAKALQEQIKRNNDLENRLKILEDKLNG
ncbi:phage tail spike protein [Macrococcoides caseolyticum]|uniref:phage tail spike protein n=1 Tax=Macrococcoides caseolyticum TaxID=69966 RepID=UPI0018E1515C|nr:phage tail spike protein [Macrococcus caseolyticus]QQB06125.1 phage tail protein [Macrococcus caseolyticus]